MSYLEKYYALENEAREYITEVLDRETQVVFWRDGDDEGDLLELPCQLYIGRHDQPYFYYITEVYKDDEGYFARGVEERSRDGFHFNLYEYLDTDIIVELADKLKNREDGTKIS